MAQELQKILDRLEFTLANLRIEADGFASSLSDANESLQGGLALSGGASSNPLAPKVGTTGALKVEIEGGGGGSLGSAAGYGAAGVLSGAIAPIAPLLGLGALITSGLGDDVAYLGTKFAGSVARGLIDEGDKIGAAIIYGIIQELKKTVVSDSFIQAFIPGAATRAAEKRYDAPGPSVDVFGAPITTIVPGMRAPDVALPPGTPDTPTFGFNVPALPTLPAGVNTFFASLPTLDDVTNVFNTGSSLLPSVFQSIPPAGNAVTPGFQPATPGGALVPPGFQNIPSAGVVVPPTLNIRGSGKGPVSDLTNLLMNIHPVPANRRTEEYRDPYTFIPNEYNVPRYNDAMNEMNNTVLEIGGAIAGEMAVEAGLLAVGGPPALGAYYGYHVWKGGLPNFFGIGTDASSAYGAEETAPYLFSNLFSPTEAQAAPTRSIYKAFNNASKSVQDRYVRAQQSRYHKDVLQWRDNPNWEFNFLDIDDPILNSEVMELSGDFIYDVGRTDERFFRGYSAVSYPKDLHKLSVGDVWEPKHALYTSRDPRVAGQFATESQPA